MRLIENSNTKTIYDKLNESYGCESYEEAAQQACIELFDAMTDDIFLGNVNVEQVDDTVKVTFNVYAYGGEPDGDGDIELNRDVTIEVPLDYTSDGHIMEVDEFYEAVSELIKNWIEEHDSPSNFYEGVMINTGSTTVTSDETGVVIEDNGNTITAGNGVTVDIDNTEDVLPDEMDLDNPVEDIPVEEPVEDIPVEEPVEELPEEPSEEIETDEEEDELEEACEEKVNEEVLEEPSEETEEEINNSKIEECDNKEVKEDKIEEAEQTIEIFQNPEFDYKITDITELQNTDSGDVRAIDMSDILVGLDEAFTMRYKDPNAVIINSFLTKRGKDYSSAIVDITTPSYAHYSLIFESTFDGKMYESTIKDACNGRKINHLCVKSTNPIKPFENAILETINLSYKLTEHRSLVEDAQLINVDSEANNEKYDTVKDPRIDANIENNEKIAKDNKKFYKNSKKFDVEEEPDQKNTQGEEIAPLTLKEDEIADEEPLVEDTLSKAIFHRKPASVSAMISEEENGIVVNQSSYVVINNKELSPEEFDDFSNNLTSKDYEWLKELYTVDEAAGATFNCIEVTGGKDYSILVDPNGYSYARYAAIKGNVEPAVEPEGEPIEDIPVE